MVNAVKIVALLSLIFVFSIGNAEPPEFDNFSQAKRYLNQRHSQGTTAYCNCPYKTVDGKLVVDIAACNYQAKNFTYRSWHVEWEHGVTAWELGSHRQCWQEVTKDRRKHCRQTDPEFAAAEADPVNLWPAIGEINARRGAKPYGMVPGEERQHGACNIEFSSVAEPPPQLRKRIGLTYLYMDAKYGITWHSEEYKDMIWRWATQ